MKKKTEEFIRNKAFPSKGITDENWEKFKHEHTGTNWVGFAIKSAEEYANHELLRFKKWYDKLTPAQKVFIENEGANPQITRKAFDLSDEQIIENYNRYQEPVNTKFEDNNDAIINAVVN